MQPSFFAPRLSIHGLILFLLVAATTSSADAHLPRQHATRAKEMPPQLFIHARLWVRARLDGSDPVVLYEVPRAQGPQDMIQFVVVPEPATAVLLISLLGIRGRSHRRMFIELSFYGADR
jgi:hypothetical protein